MPYDAHTNFAYSTVATAPSPALSGLSLTVASGDGAKFPAAPFNVTVWPSGAQPTTTNAEIVRVTNISGDVFTIKRTQEGTIAQSIAVNYQIAATITAKTLTDIEGTVHAAQPTVTIPSYGSFVISEEYLVDDTHEVVVDDTSEIISEQPFFTNYLGINKTPSEDVYIQDNYSHIALDEYITDSSHELVLLGTNSEFEIEPNSGINAADKSSSSQQTFIGSISSAGGVVTAESSNLNQSSAITPDFSNGNLGYFEWTGGATMTIANPINVPTAGFGGIYSLLIRNQRGANITVLSWGTTYKGGMPTATTFPNNAYMNFLFWYSSATTFMVFLAGDGNVTSNNGWT